MRIELCTPALKTKVCKNCKAKMTKVEIYVLHKLCYFKKVKCSFYFDTSSVSNFVDSKETFKKRLFYPAITAPTIAHVCVCECVCACEGRHPEGAPLGKGSLSKFKPEYTTNQNIQPSQGRLVARKRATAKGAKALRRIGRPGRPVRHPQRRARHPPLSPQSCDTTLLASPLSPL